MGWFSKDKTTVATEETKEEHIGVGVSEFGSNFTSRTARHLKSSNVSTPKGSNSSTVNDTFITSDIVHKCVDYIAKQTSQVRFNVKQIDKKTGKPVDVKDKKLMALFKTVPNDYQTWGELLYLDTLAQHLTGNSYITFEKVKGKYELWCIAEPQEMEVVVDKEDGLITGYVFNSLVEYDKSEIIHNKNMILGNNYYGASTITSLIDTLTMEGYATEDIIKFYENGLVSTSILTSEQPLTPKQANDLTSELSLKYGMKNGKRHSLIVLPNNLSIKPLRLSPQEAMLLDSLGITHDRVLSTFHLHRMVLGGDIESYTHSIDELVNLQFTNAVRPVINKFRENLEAFLRRTLKNMDLIIEVDYSNLPEVQLAKLVHHEKARTLYTSGLASLNEARSILGFPSIDAELADQNHLPEFLLGSSLHTIQNLSADDIQSLREQNTMTDTDLKATDNLGGTNTGKKDKNE